VETRLAQIRFKDSARLLISLMVKWKAVFDLVWSGATQSMVWNLNKVVIKVEFENIAKDCFSWYGNDTCWNWHAVQLENLFLCKRTWKYKSVNMQTKLVCWVVAFRISLNVVYWIGWVPFKKFTCCIEKTVLKLNTHFVMQLSLLYLHAPFSSCAAFYHVLFCNHRFNVWIV
jgi:hypothetical protein